MSRNSRTYDSRRKILLFGGNLYILGEQLSFLSAVPLPLMLLGIAAVIIFLTEITSNTAIIQVMLPVATPPNAVVFGTQRIQIKGMVKVGIKLNLIMLIAVVSVVWFLRPLLP